MEKEKVSSRLKAVIMAMEKVSILAKEKEPVPSGSAIGGL